MKAAYGFSLALNGPRTKEASYPKNIVLCSLQSTWKCFGGPNLDRAWPSINDVRTFIITWARVN